MKKAKRKNYIIVGAIYIATIALVLYLASWYNTYQEYKKEIPVLQDIVFQIKEDEVESYLMENPTSILYFCKVSNNECREFEESFKDIIIDNDYQEIITYVNLEETENEQNYLTNFIDKYSSTDFKTDKIPCLIKITDGKIEAIEDGLNGATLTTSEAQKFIDVNKTGL